MKKVIFLVVVVCTIIEGISNAGASVIVARNAQLIEACE